MLKNANIQKIDFLHISNSNQLPHCCGLVNLSA